MKAEPDGYLSGDYAESLAEFGKPQFLPASGGWILRRRIASGGHVDAMGCYPLFVCADWQRLEEDMAALGTDCVSVALVADPFGDYTTELLNRCFPDCMASFKSHFVVDCSRPLFSTVSSHHRYYARRSLRNIAVEVCNDPGAYLEDWCSLYSTLTNRHELRGIKAFSKQAFRRQLAVPGLVMFLARSNNLIVGAHLWYLQSGVAYSHLAAVNDEGYRLMASYALHCCAIESFYSRVSWVNLGAAAGLSAGASTGLEQFKKGWATGTRTSYFCGRIFNRVLYDELSARNAGSGMAGYFPAYRRGEF